MNNTEAILEHLREAERLLSEETAQMIDSAPRKRFGEAIQSVNSARWLLSPECTKHNDRLRQYVQYDTSQLE